MLMTLFVLHKMVVQYILMAVTEADSWVLLNLYE